MSMREYLVTPHYELKDSLPREKAIRHLHEAFRKAAAKIRPEVAAIVKRTGGKMINDGSGFGVEGHPAQYSSFLLVKMTEAAAREVKAVKGVQSVTPNGKVWAI